MPLLLNSSLCSCARSVPEWELTLYQPATHTEFRLHAWVTG